MSLVSYSSSEESSTESTCPKNSKVQLKKRKAEDALKPPSSKPPPPLPTTFHSLYATNVRTSTTDDPSLHGGRKRQLAHVQGNWSSHVFLEWLPDKSQLEHLDSLIAQAESLLNLSTTTPPQHADTRALTSFLHSPLNVQLPLHISLSAPLGLDTSTKDLFRDRLVDAISAAKIGAIVVRPLLLDLVPNFERSRWFLVLRVGDVLGEYESQHGGVTRRLERVLSVCNRVCLESGLPLLYQRGEDVGIDVHTNSGIDVVGSRTADPIGGQENGGKEDEGSHAVNPFHISVAWTLEGASDDTRTTIQNIDLTQLEEARIRFEKVKVKIGNVVDEISL